VQLYCYLLIRNSATINQHPAWTCAPLIKAGGTATKQNIYKTAFPDVDLRYEVTVERHIFLLQR
jgi:hypothetical protein